MESLEASWEKQAMASGPHAAYVSVTRGTQTQSRSPHLSSLAECFLDSLYIYNYIIFIIYNNNNNNNETYGCWGTEARDSFSRLAAPLALQLHCSKSKALVSIYQRLNLTLVRCTARALLSRVGTQTPEG